MPAKVFELDEIGTVSVYKRRGTRSIRLGFDSKGEIKITMPTWIPYRAAVDFALQRIDWIRKHQPEPTRAYKHGDRIGKAHRLVFIADPAVSSTQVRLKSTEITVKYPSGVRAMDPKVQAAAERGAKKALLQEAERLLPQRLAALAEAHGFAYTSVTVKQLKTKWGSCDQRHNITLNYYLLQLPWNLIDYVLIHELVHTEHLNHSVEFWARFEESLPGAKKIRKELRTYKTSVIAT